MTSPSLKYPYNLPWRGVVVGTAFSVGLVCWLAHLAKGYAGWFSVCVMTASIFLWILPLFLLLRRLVFPRTIELKNDALLFQRGFFRTRTVQIPYSDIMQIGESRQARQISLRLYTGKGPLEIPHSHLPDLKSYLKVKRFILARAGIALSSIKNRSEERTWTVAPEPVLSWREPEVWSKYRTSLFRSRPFSWRLKRALWFFVRCLGIIVLPWLLLQLGGWSTSPFVGYLCLAVPVTLFFTWLHWLYAAYPAWAAEIRIWKNGMSQSNGKQTAYWNFREFTGWAIMERSFEGETLLILLLRSRYGVRGIALPTSEIRDRIIQILQDNKIPQVADLMPSWE